METGRGPAAWIIGRRVTEEGKSWATGQKGEREPKFKGNLWANGWKTATLSVIVLWDDDSTYWKIFSLCLHFGHRFSCLRLGSERERDEKKLFALVSCLKLSRKRTEQGLISTACTTASCCLAHQKNESCVQSQLGECKLGKIRQEAAKPGMFCIMFKFSH